MTDFLTSLTARSFGTETAIRPRAASLFEPVRHGDGALREASAAEPIGAAIARDVEVESDGERKQNRPARPSREDGTTSAARHAANEGPVSVVIPQLRNDSARCSANVGASVEASVEERWEEEDAVVAAQVRPRRSAPSQEENVNESGPALRSDSEDGAPKRVSARTPAASSTRDEFPEKDHRGLVLPPKVITDLTAQMKNAALAMNVAPNARMREKAGRASPVPATELEPSVHVTIGRVEVRATSESKQASRSRAASPVMSLEEYLRRRTQRGGQ